MPKGGVDFMTNVDQWPPLAKALLRIYVVVVNQLFHLYSGKRLGLRLISTSQFAAAALVKCPRGP